VAIFAGPGSHACTAVGRSSLMRAKFVDYYPRQYYTSQHPSISPSLCIRLQ